MVLLVPVRDLELAERADRRSEFARAGKSEGTWRVYEKAFARFAAWAEDHGGGGPPASAETVADYAIFLFDAKKSVSTIHVAMSSIAHRHALVGVPSPLLHPQVSEILAGIYRRAGKERRGRGASDPLLPDDIRRLVTRLEPGLRGARDLALLTFGFATGFRRSELVRVRVEDLTFEGDGVVVRLAWSKRDQTGEGHSRRVHSGDHPELCPVSNLRLWLAAAGLRSGPIFRPIIREVVQPNALSARRVDQIIRELGRRFEKSGGALRASHYSAHSLRSGLCTAAALAGKPEWEIGKHVDHKSPQSTAKYIRTAGVLRSTLTKGIGL